MATTVRISENAHEVLKQLSERERISMTEALDRITAEWKRISFFEQLNASFSALKSDPDAWQSELEERRLWDNSLSDDLDDRR